MVKHIKEATIIKSAGNKPKRISEYIGRVNSATSDVSIAVMKSPAGWLEPAQKPEFDEYTLVLKGILQVVCGDKTLQISAGEAIFVSKGEHVQYSTPGEEGAEYVAVCLPAFSPDAVHRES